MIKIDQVIIVEGKYDKIKLSSFIDAAIVTTDGFRIYKDKNKMNMIRKLAKQSGVIILTDSDVAGFKIRNFISGILPKEKIINVYIPQIIGKEKRKTEPSKENMLGVEGVEKDVIIKSLKQAGLINNDYIKKTNDKKITKLDFYKDGLIGAQASKLKRQKIKSKLNLPTYLSTKSLIDVLNKLLTFDEYKKLVKEIYID